MQCNDINVSVTWSSGRLPHCNSQHHKARTNVAFACNIKYYTYLAIRFNKIEHALKDNKAKLAQAHVNYFRKS